MAVQQTTLNRQITRLLLPGRMQKPLQTIVTIRKILSENVKENELIFANLFQNRCETCPLLI